MRVSMIRMMQDAEEQEKLALERLREHQKKVKEEEEQVAMQSGQNPLEATFLKQMSRTMYMSGNDTVEDRLRKMKHYRQKGSDALSADTFLKQ